jgi:hypothetical protein
VKEIREEITVDELDQIYGPKNTLKKEYGEVPGYIIFPHLSTIAEANSLPEWSLSIITAKVLQYCRRLHFMHIAGQKALRRESKFIARLDHASPSLTWPEELEILYHLEGMVLYGRCALDAIAHVSNALLFRGGDGMFIEDRFFEFSKRILKSRMDVLADLKESLTDSSGEQPSWFRLLCGTESGRSLRDRLSYQRIARIEYLESRPGDEMEVCHAVIKTIDEGKPRFNRMPLIQLVDDIRFGVMNFAVNLEKAMVKRFMPQAAT